MFTKYVLVKRCATIVTVDGNSHQMTDRGLVTLDRV